MAELLLSEVPLKKRKIKAQSPDQDRSCRQVPVSLLSSAELLLQIPPNSNTSLPVWESVNAAQAEVQWSVTPYGITIQITPLTKQSNGQPDTQPSSLSESETQLSTLPASLPVPSIQPLSQSVLMTTPCRAPHSYRIIPTHPQPLLSSQNQPLGLTAPLTTAQLQPLPQYQGHSHPASSYKDIIGPSEDTYEVTDLLFQPAPKAKWVQQACFHTGPSEEACICDQFLLGHCRNGFDCQLHHTPYPFHWQLRRQDTHQWVSTSHSAQVKLEKLYCDRNRDTARLQDMEDVFTLQFDTMTVENSEKYDKARRLSNSSNPERNHHFPTVWNNYWWNEYNWEQYRNEVSMLLLEMKETGKSSCRFHIGKQEYEVDFSSLTQRNLTTGFTRRVRRRPTFRSPFSLKRHLKTVVLCEASKYFGQVLPSLSVDPLQEFSSWYPPVWTRSPDQGFSLVEVPPSAKAYQSIHCLFYSTMSETELEIVSIQQVQNVFQWDKYRRQKEHMKSCSTIKRGSLEQHLFHGTTEDSTKEICLNNFDPRESGKNGVVYGRGSYFARDASYSDTYARASGEENCQHMFLAKVLVGKMTIGKTTFCRPPRLSPRKSGYELYDSCVDRKKNPSIFVVFDSCQCYPYYLIKYKAVSDTVKIFETNKMAELLPSEVPLKKRKIEAQSPDQESSCRQVPVSLLSSTELLLQIPPNTNTSLPVWECVNAPQAGMQWSEAPYSITVQITPLTTQKARSNDQPVNQPQPPCQFKHVPLPVCLLPTLSGLDHNGDTDCPSVFFKLAAKTFYTKPSKYIHICDDFLTGCCPHKLSCERHHTPLPFHWQLRHWNTQQWVNISLSAQVKLEKLYCDPDQETIRLQDIFPIRTEAFTLHLETKKVTSEKYDKARRLSSSYDPEMSPHFPTEWSIYWWNDGKWEKYEKEVSKELVGAIEAGETSRGFYIGKQLYEVDFSRMIQMNLTTKFERRIRWRPTFRSPFSIKSNLKTVSLGEPPRPFGQVLPRLSVDPLQEFSSWYPPVWNLSPNQGFSLVEVPPSAKAYQSIHCLFYSTMNETKTEIISIQQVQNIFHWDRYRRQKEHMQIHSTAHSWSLEQHLFHGTTEDCAKEICLNNFDPRVSGKNRAVYGRGSYFARDARYSLKYAAKSGGGNQHMFLAKVLVGNVTLGKATYSRPPRLNPLTPGYELYDTCVDKISDPSIFVVFDNCQCYPYYLIKYKAVSDLVNICE
ncbi:uncharacterized protein LOC135259072 [Anguilla rostrata]|uniref:uncharacterized protein LOC135259072 n=1 Tax=Anguilla rostrata TaxID=7938 RepID=UPI0030D38840